MILKIGHRGAMGYEPENTLLSFKKAIELDVDMVELDTHLCKTGEVVVIHDETIDRTTDGSGYVRNMTFKELRSFNSGKGQKIPTLQEVLDLIDRKAKINIELKGEGVCKPLLEILSEYVGSYGWSYNDFYISSLNIDWLLELNKLNPAIKLGIVLNSLSVKITAFSERLNLHSANPAMDLTDNKFVRDAHREGLKVFVWTVNDYNDIARMKSLGVDGIFSDFPDRL